VKILILTTFVGFIAGSAYCADIDTHDIVAKSIVNYEKDWMAALDFTCTQRDVTKDASGEPKTIEVSQVTVLNGTPYTRLIAKNGHPLDAEEARRENEKYEKAVAARDRETPEQREKRLRKYQEEWGFLHEVPDAFNLKLLGHETISGRPNYLIELTPKPGHTPQSKTARIFPNIEGKLWIDEQDLRWTKAVAHVIDTISVGWVLARIGPGAHITIKQVKVDNEHWLPRELDVNGTAKIMLVKNRALDETVSYSDYKRIRDTQATAAAKNR